MRGIEADDPAADDRDLAGHHAGNPAQQNAASAVFLFQRGGACLYRHAPRDLAHRLEQRQGAVLSRHRFIGDCRHARLHQFRRLFRVCGEMQIREQHLAFVEQCAFGRQRLLHFHDHLAFSEDLRRFLLDCSASGFVIGIGCADAGAGAAFHPDLMPMSFQLAHAFGCQAHPVFMGLDLTDSTNAHTQIPSADLFAPYVGARCGCENVPRGENRNKLV